MIDAGLPLVQCLEILAGQQENKNISEGAGGDARFGRGGATLSAAMLQIQKFSMRCNE